MNTKKVWAVWFSATGTTEKVVNAIAQNIAEKLALPCETVSFNTPAARQQELNFCADDLVVLGVPVYAGRVPNLILPYIRDSIHGNGALVVPVVLYGNRNFDDGLMELRNVTRDNGFHPITAGAFVGEHSFSTTLGAGRPDADDMALAMELAAKTVEKVQALTEAPTEAVAVEGCDPIRPYYTPRDRHGNPITTFLKAKPVTDMDKCGNCGLCVQLCPMGSIDPENVANVVGKCIKCCACVKKCPTGAKYFTDEGYLYHQHELEEVYGIRRAETKIFF